MTATVWYVPKANQLLLVAKMNQKFFPGIRYWAIYDGEEVIKTGKLGQPEPDSELRKSGWVKLGNF